MSVTRIPVALPTAPYDVVVGDSVLDDLAAHVPLPSNARRVAVVSNTTVHTLYGSRVRAGLAALGLEHHWMAVPDGENAKTLATLETLYHRFAAVPLGRGDLVVALGGGVVGDLAGFAAATWNRGVPIVQVPTTLLAQVDSGVGGKTGINLPEGKNLVGAFHQPLVVLADTGVLATLPERERLSGLGEVAKYGFIDDPVVLELLASDPAAARAGSPEVLTEVVRRGVAVKARIVAADERESGERALLNYGHTVGHAIEALSGYRTYRHGEAVALGMVFAARLGERLGVSERGLAARTVEVLAGLGLPVGGLRLEPAAIWEVMARDKKARGATGPDVGAGAAGACVNEDGGAGAGGDAGHGVRFVLCERPGRALLVDPPPRRLVDEVLRSLATG